MGNITFEEKIKTIKDWLGTGSINIFGLPMSGKDTQGIRLAEALDAKFISSGMIIRAKEAESKEKYSESGDLIPTNVFYEWVIPYIERRDLSRYPLIMSSIGRWSGEENKVIAVAAETGHSIKAAIILDVSEADVEKRFATSKVLKDREDRQDDRDLDIFHKRIEEFNTKTMPVIRHYQDLGLLVEVNGDQLREAVFNEIVDKLYDKAIAQPKDPPLSIHHRIRITFFTRPPISLRNS